MPDHKLYQEFQSFSIHDVIKKHNEDISKLASITPEELKDVKEVFIKDSPELEQALEEDTGLGEVFINEEPIKELSPVSDETIDFLKLTPEEVKDLEESLKRYNDQANTKSE